MNWLWQKQIMAAITPTKGVSRMVSIIQEATCLRTDQGRRYSWCTALIIRNIKIPLIVAGIDEWRGLNKDYLFDSCKKSIQPNYFKIQ